MVLAGERVCGLVTCMNTCDKLTTLTVPPSASGYCDKFTKLLQTKTNKEKDAIGNHRSHVECSMNYSYTLGHPLKHRLKHLDLATAEIRFEKSCIMISKRIQSPLFRSSLLFKAAQAVT